MRAGGAGRGGRGRPCPWRMTCRELPRTPRGDPAGGGHCSLSGVVLAAFLSFAWVSPLAEAWTDVAELEVSRGVQALGGVISITPEFNARP